MEKESSNTNEYQGYKNYLTTDDNLLDKEPKSDILDFSTIEYEQELQSKKQLQTSQNKSSQPRIEQCERRHNTEELSRIFFLENKISDTKQDLVEIESSLDSWKGRKRDKIKQWAENLRELHDLGVYEMPISTIAVTIIDELKKLGVKGSLDYVREVLPDDYKNQRFKQLAQIAHEKRKINEIKPEIESQEWKTQGYPCDVQDIDIQPYYSYCRPEGMSSSNNGR